MSRFQRGPSRLLGLAALSMVAAIDADPPCAECGHPRSYHDTTADGSKGGTHCAGWKREHGLEPCPCGSFKSQETF